MAEKEYIEREALSQAILDLPPKMDEQGYGWLCRRGVWQMVNDFPAADVRPVVHGEWLRTQAYPHRIYCSNCYVTFIRNDEFLELKETPHNFCPNCGADMRETEDEKT